MNNPNDFDYGWEHKVEYKGCKIEGDTFDLVLKVPIVQSKSIFDKACNAVSATLIWWAAKISGYEIHYMFNVSYTEKHDL